MIQVVVEAIGEYHEVIDIDSYVSEDSFYLSLDIRWAVPESHDGNHKKFLATMGVNCQFIVIIEMNSPLMKEL